LSRTLKPAPVGHPSAGPAEPNFVRRGRSSMVRTRTEGGKSINLRGLEREAGQSRYEFAYEAEGFGANPAGQAKPPTGSRNKAGRLTPTSRPTGR
jgi:hypothetical protein